MAVDLALGANQGPEGGRDDEAGREVELRREVEHPAMIAQSSGHREGMMRGPGHRHGQDEELRMAGQQAEQVAAVETRRHASSGHRHPVNRAMYDDAPLGARIADKVTGFMGSWNFIIVQTVIVLVWITGNVFLIFHFDIYPFILLNLAFSTQAAYAAPLILLAGNRAAIRDRLTLEHTAAEADIEDRQDRELLSGNTKIVEQVAALEQRILQLETNILARIDAGKGA
jgi:uncharacterized membrane protein